MEENEEDLNLPADDENHSENEQGLNENQDAAADSESDGISQEASIIEEEEDNALTKVTGMYKDWFLDYASYVILERAVPAIEDGFKPVQRRIMHALKELDDGRYNKVANVVGHTMQYHPHGDASIADAMVQMGQKDLLIDTQGNWGNILTGDRAAASRYIEARLSKFALDVVFSPKITEWQQSYDGRKKEPVNLPVMFPLLLAQGAEGIAVGLSTKVLPHNFIELIDSSIKHLKGQRFKIYPDFPTAGIIDEHSHIAAASINEGGHNSSAEVTIEDVLNDEDIDIYRNLAGGVTSIQILHGSANPIGGRSAIIKLKWGEAADGLVYHNSPKFIKFALGENVKQSRSRTNSRFPQSRMGVEQVFMDYFSRAKAYDQLKKSGKPYRKDTEMEVLAEILNKERFISCHSYVQSEINMLMKVAEKFDFNINTFTHILEGYKVADKMKAHGVGGSTFSDWWGYKYEVNDAIPYNAAIMHNAGVVVAINSDDAEMSRRLNQEAAKSVKYGGISEEDAWKFVTLNPAKLLHLDERVGSLKVGKDADVVLWSDHPLSIYAKAEKTIIEGVTYFDLARDLQMREAIKKEKSELINLMLQDKNKGLKTQPVKKKEKVLLHCDSME